MDNQDFITSLTLKNAIAEHTSIYLNSLVKKDHARKKKYFSLNKCQTSYSEGLVCLNVCCSRSCLNCPITTVNIIMCEIILVQYRLGCITLLTFKCKEVNDVNMLLNYVI